MQIRIYTNKLLLFNFHMLAETIISISIRSTRMLFTIDNAMNCPLYYDLLLSNCSSLNDWEICYWFWSNYLKYKYIFNDNFNIFLLVNFYCSYSSICYKTGNRCRTTSCPPVNYYRKSCSYSADSICSLSNNFTLLPVYKKIMQKISIVRNVLFLPVII